MTNRISFSLSVKEVMNFDRIKTSKNFRIYVLSREMTNLSFKWQGIDSDHFSFIQSTVSFSSENNLCITKNGSFKSIKKWKYRGKSLGKISCGDNKYLFFVVMTVVKDSIYEKVVRSSDNNWPSLLNKLKNYPIC